MTIRELLLGEISKKHSDEIAKMTVKNPLIFDELWDISLSDEEPVNWRAAWVIKSIWEKHPHLVGPHIQKMRLALPGIKKGGVKREYLKMISEFPLPENEEELGILLKTCFDYLADPIEPAAVKVHSISILCEISKSIPEIIPELCTTIEVAMQEGSPGIVNRGEKALKELHQIEFNFSKAKL
jgi:hypothetical protein